MKLRPTPIYLHEDLKPARIPQGFILVQDTREQKPLFTCPVEGLEVVTDTLWPVSLDVPVIAGGGITDGRGVAAALALGAEGVIMGTRMMATKECPIHDNLKQAFVQAREVDTVLALRSVGNTHRLWNNKAAQVVLELEAQKAPLFTLIQAASGEKAEKMYREGDIDLGVVSCGQGVGLIKDIPTVKELLDRIMSEAEEVISKLGKKAK